MERTQSATRTGAASIEGTPKAQTMRSDHREMRRDRRDGRQDPRTGSRQRRIGV
jgi:hypothetical protein